jgi:hypothetical protein
MDDAAGFLGGLFVLALVVGGVTLAGLMVTSKAVLFSEEELQSSDTILGWGFKCSYFTGLRVVERYSHSDTGCTRFIDVGH